MGIKQSLSRDDIIDAALRKLNVIQTGGSGSTNQTADGAEALNAIIKNLDATIGLKWAISGTSFGFLTETSKVRYALTPSVRWLENVSIATAAATSLTNGALTSGTSWTAANDFSLAANVASYTHSAGSGTLTQANASLAIAPVAYSWYLFKYTCSGRAGRPAVTIPNTTAAEAVTIPIEDGTCGVVFQWGSSTSADFALSATSVTSDAFTLDDLGLYELTDTEYPLLPMTVDEYNSVGSKVGSSDSPLYYFLSMDQTPPSMYLYPPPSTSSYCVRYWGRRSLDIFDDSTDTIDLPEEWYRFVIYQLATDLADEYGKTPAERQLLQQKAMNALQSCQGPQAGFVTNYNPAKEA